MIRPSFAFAPGQNAAASSSRRWQPHGVHVAIHTPSKASMVVLDVAFRSQLGPGVEMQQRPSIIVHRLEDGVCVSVGLEERREKERKE